MSYNLENKGRRRGWVKSKNQKFGANLGICKV